MTTMRFAALRRRFRSDQRGNVAMLVAVSIVPLTLASMGALDLTRSITAKVALQDALDAAALAAGRSSTNDPSQLQQMGSRVLQQNLAGARDFTVTSATFTFGTGGTIVAKAQATFQPSMSGLFGGGPARLGASSEVTRANSILEIALVLDNTGSMGQSLGWGQSSKISYLRTAAANFVDTMAKAAAQNSTAKSVQISLVPFANLVNVGSSYATSSWIDQSGASPINNEIFTTAQGVTQSANRFDLFKALNTSWAGCVEMRQAPYDVQDTAPSTATPATLFTPFFAPDELDGARGNDYVTDPSPKKDSKGKIISDWWYAQGDVAKYSNTPKVTLSTSQGPNLGCSMLPIQRLTTDFAGLKTAISKMSAGGETNIPLGLVWGWHTLSPNAPFADGVPYGSPKHKKIVVLMTDGQNTMSTDSRNNNNSHSSGAGYVWQGRLIQADGTKLVSISSTDADRTAAMDSRLQLLCTNMKAPSADIEIYAVGVGVTTQSATLLKSCASGADHYFDVSSGTDIDVTFQNIANQIAQLHLSK
jgi:Flp pilus assembly protein TadG